MKFFDVGPGTTSATHLPPDPADSKRRHFWNQVFNFIVTVLQVYWELGARTGTKLKLVVSTFTFWKHFLFSKLFSSLNLDKTVWLWIGFPINFTWFFRCEMGLIDENPKMRHQNLKHRHPPPSRFEYCPQRPRSSILSSIGDLRTVPGLYNPYPSQKPCVEELTGR